ncbi:MAG: hypothetical protein ACFB2Z_07475 [Maricaulaceae bacterium]
MVDLSEDLAGVVAAFKNARRAERGRTLAFMGLGPRCGASTVAREFARLCAAGASKPVVLFDLGFNRNPHYAAFAQASARARYGALGAARPAVMGGRQFWRVNPAVVRADGKRAGDDLLGLHQVGASALFVSAFRHEGLRPRQRVLLAHDPTYWREAKRRCEAVIVDTPGPHKGRAGLKLAAQLDAVVLVAGPNVTDQDVWAGAQAVDTLGGRCVGLILSRVGAAKRPVNRPRAA